MPLKDTSKLTKCGCGRSPNGFCLGWHSLSEEDYQLRLKEFVEFDNRVIMKNEYYDLDKDD